jgi:hypothetical protein
VAAIHGKPRDLLLRVLTVDRDRIEDGATLDHLDQERREVRVELSPGKTDDLAERVCNGARPALLG